MRILVYTDGSKDAEQAAALLEKLGAARGGEVTIFAVSPRRDHEDELEQSADRIEHALEDDTTQVRTVIRLGDATRQLLEEAEQGRYDLVIVAREHHGHPPRLRFRSTTHELARHVPSHLLVARNVPDRLRRILICSAAETPSAETVRLAGLITAGSGAEISLLHVMSQVSLRADSPEEDLQTSAEGAIERHTPEGKHFEKSIRDLRAAGIAGEIHPILRHGLVVDEVLDEIRQGDYDLLVVGSHRQPTLTRWLDILLDDVAGELLVKTPISTLVIYQHEQTPTPPPS